MFHTASDSTAAEDRHVVEKAISLLGDFTTLGDSSYGPLTVATLSSLREFFQRDTIHRPGPRMWAALGHLAATMEAMANETCPPSFYLSSLDPGVGKSETVAHFVRALLDSPDHKHVGVLICVSRLDEIKSFVSRMRLPDSAYSVLTADKDVNGLAFLPPQQGQVLFTTQQMVESRCKGSSFALAQTFHYEGRPRQVRIWDESILPGQTLTLNRDDIGFLFKPLRSRFPKLTNQLDSLFADIPKMKDGAVVPVPDFAEDHGVEVNDVMRLLKDYPKDQQVAASALWFLSGKTVVVRQDGKYGNTLLDYRETLPGDLAPVVVLDASGRVRGTYSQWETGRGNLTRLLSAPKSYRNLRVHVWQRGGGKSAFANEGQLLADGIATTISKKPDEEWLVVCHQAKPGQFDVEATVRDLLKGNTKVHFITWGNHQATNEFSHVSNVVLAGTLFYRTSHYESLGRLAAGRRPEDGQFAKRDYDDVMHGEHSHLVLQAACRGSVRLCEGNACQPCNLYLIASLASGIPRSLKMIFPGCTVVTWQPVPKALTGKVKQAVEYIRRWFCDNPSAVLPFREVMREIGMSDTSNFRKHVRLHPDFVEALGELGVIEHGEGKYRRGFVRLVHYFGFDVEEDGYRFA